MLKTKDFYFDLPDELIAQKPAEKRSESRLMVLNRKNQSIHHTVISRIHEYLPKNSCIVINNSRVRKARFYCSLDTGTELEILFLEEKSPSVWEIMASKTRRLKLGRKIVLPGNITGEVIFSESGQNRLIQLSRTISEDYFSQFGHVPLPPYIDRKDTLDDAERYQTVYAEKIGSVAAPTAGLHFTEIIMKQLKAQGSSIVPVTLHVGAGTFLPMRGDAVADHKMHYESYEIPEETVDQIRKTTSLGNKVIAVGTTSVRTLESAADRESNTILKAGSGRTNLFIKPGFNFAVVDHLLTNFHTPESTLLVLVSTFAGYDFIMRAYTEAVKEKYRFFSYGDAMLII